jgi:hypothetical protein
LLLRILFQNHGHYIPLVADGECGKECFILKLVSILENRVSRALVNSRLLLDECTLHGLLQAVRNMLLELNYNDEEISHNFWLDFHSRIIAAVKLAFDIALSIIASSNFGDDSVCLNESFSQLVLNQAFHTIKNGAQLLCTIIQKSPLPESRASASHLSFDLISQSTKLIRDLLFDSRQSGAFNAIYEMYTAICKVLSESRRDFLSEMPKIWLEVSSCFYNTN